MEENKNTKFGRFAIWFGDTVGSVKGFTISLVAFFIWCALGRPMDFSNTWQLAANTPTTWVELFLAISTLYVGNRVERWQKHHQMVLERRLKRMEQLIEAVAASNGINPDDFKYEYSQELDHF